jgi:putative acetyltransferase
MNPVIRDFKVADAAACAELIKKNKDNLGDLYNAEELIKSSSYTRFLIAEIDGKVMGLIGFSDLKNGIAMLGTACVDPTLHGQGIGTKLLQATIELGKTQNYRKLLLLTHEKNKAMMILAIKQGFIPEGSLKNHFRDGKDVIYFSYFYN